MAEGNQNSEKALGHDPLQDLNLEWMGEEEETVEAVEEEQEAEKALGRDPLVDLDLRWMQEEKKEKERGEKAAPPADMAQVETEEPVVEVREEVERRAMEAQKRAQEETPEKVPAEEPPELAQAARPAETPSGQPSLPQATFHFPADFRWGVATAAHQVEGDNTQSDWSDWERQEGRIKEGHTAGRACNWWKNAEADFDRAAAMGMNALRISVEWARIEPRQGQFDDAALNRYREMLQGLRERGIEPMVTLHHFTNPRWLAEHGGWENPKAIDLFVRFTRHVVEALNPYCDLWCTINEPNVYGYLGYVEGNRPPGKSDFRAAMGVIRHLLMGHAAAYREIHALQPQARVGLAHHVRIFDPANPRSLLDRWSTGLADRAFNQAILTALTKGRWSIPLGFGLAWKLRGTLDWIGLNYYTRELIAFDRAHPETLFSRRLHADDAELLDGGYGEFYPQGIFRSLKRLAGLGLPIYITENGIPDDDGDQRPRYLLTHLHQMWHAILLCYPVMGYYHWTLVDNFEWDDGWTLRFGLFGLNRKRGTRRRRPGADLYADVIQANAITPQIIEEYTPELRPELLPGCRRNP